MLRLIAKLNLSIVTDFTYLKYPIVGANSRPRHYRASLPDLLRTSKGLSLVAVRILS